MYLEKLSSVPRVETTIIGVMGSITSGKSRNMQLNSDQNFPSDFPLYPGANLIEDIDHVRVWKVDAPVEAIFEFYRESLGPRYKLTRSAIWEQRRRIAIEDTDHTWGYGLIELIPPPSDVSTSTIMVVLGLAETPILDPREGGATSPVPTSRSLDLPPSFPVELVPIPDSAILEKVEATTELPGSAEVWLVSMRMATSVNEAIDFYLPRLSTASFELAVAELGADRGLSFSNRHFEGNMVISPTSVYDVLIHLSLEKLLET